MPRALNLAVVAPLAAPIGEPEPYGNHALLIDLARGLRARGHRVRLYAAEGSRVPGVEVLGFPVEAQARGAFIHPGRTAGPSPAMRLSFERVFARLCRDRPDAVSQHAFDAEAIELAEGLPVLHTLHLPPLVPAMVEACRHTRAPLVAVSQSAARDWRAVGVETRVIPNGVPDIAPPPADAVRRVAIVAGRICPEKGSVTAIRAARAAGLEAHVVGGIYDRDYFAREVKPLLGPDARLEASVPRARLWSYFARAAACLMPIDWDEPFGLAAAEAQVAGCPVVGYARGALPEIVEQGVSGILVPPGDEAALAAALHDVHLLDRARVRQSARARLLFPPCLEGYEAALQELAGRRGGAVAAPKRSGLGL